MLESALASAGAGQAGEHAGQLEHTHGTAIGGSNQRQIVPECPAAGSRVGRSPGDASTAAQPWESPALRLLPGKKNSPVLNAKHEPTQLASALHLNFPARSCARSLC